MTEVIIPAFRDAPEEGKIVGHLLAGYSELEVEMLQCAFLVSNDIDAAVRTLYKDRGESRRIEAARKITEQAYINAGLESKYALTMDNMDWCRLLRNRYAHCLVLHSDRGIVLHGS